ncbi:MAG: branched-chain amino acid ABC transporter substrate-binding protein [Rhodospirillaceae bacterium]|nr:branched-chain amino acid ABC transporter substrate-binding protein [Rhodospirillaceae bacterium]
MRSRIVIDSRLIAAQLLMALLLTSCAGGPSGPTQAEKEAAAARFATEVAAAQAAAEEAGTIHIGVAGPMTGDFEAYGIDMRRGAELAVADINAAGGVLGREVVLEVADDRCGIEDADAAARELVSRGVVFVDGHFCSGSSIRGGKIYARADVLQITPSSTNSLLTDTAVQDKVTTLLRVVGRDDMQGDFAGEWLATSHAGQPIAVVSDNSLYGKGIAARLLAKLKEKGIRPVIDGQFTQGQTSYATLVEALKKSGTRVLYVAAYHDDIGRIAWALRVAKLDIELVGPDVLNNPEFWSFSQSKGNGVRFSDFAPAVERPEAAEVVARFRAQGIEPTNYTLNAYAAVRVFAAGAEATKGTDAKAIANYLRQNSVKTILGEISWDEKGDLRESNYIWYVWQDGLIMRK